MVRRSQKVRETGDYTRLYLVDSTLLLCALGRKLRKTTQLARTYEVLKLADMLEGNEEVTNNIKECVQYLRRDEEGTLEGNSNNWTQKPVKELITSLGEKVVGYDDVD